MKPNINKLFSWAKANAVPICIFFFFLVIYSLTIYRGIGGRINFGDSTKWQYLYQVNGLPHATGYPQMLLLTEVFSRLLFFLNAPERITFISVFFGSLTVSIFYLTSLLLTNNKIGSIISSMFWGFTVTFWALSTEAEVYTLNTFYIITIIFLFVKFNKTNDNTFAFAGIGVYAFSFGNHLSMITLLPSIIFIIYNSKKEFIFNWKHLLIVFLMTAICSLQYLFIYFRASSDHISVFNSELIKHPTFKSFLNYLTGDNYVIGSSSLLKNFTLKEIVLDRFPIFFGYLNLNFNPFGLLLGMAGFLYFVFVRKEYVITIFLSLMVLGQLSFSIRYDVPDLVVFFLPVYMIFSLFISFLYSAKKTIVLQSIVSFLTIFNVFGLDTINFIREPSQIEYVIIEPIFSLYDRSDYPLYYPAEERYSEKTYFNYLKAHSLINKNRNVITHQIQLDSLNAFYVLPQDAYLFSDTAKYVLNIAKQLDIKTYVQEKVAQRKVVFISAKDEAIGQLNNDFIQYITNMNGSINALGYRGSYCAVLYENKICDVTSNASAVELSSKTSLCIVTPNKLNYTIHSAGLNFGNKSVIAVNGINYGLQKRGLNIIVYDIENENVSEYVNFDTHVGEKKELFLVKRKK